jgi:hypothetical protein
MRVFPYKMLIITGEVAFDKLVRISDKPNEKSLFHPNIDKRGPSQRSPNGFTATRWGLF